MDQQKELQSARDKARYRMREGVASMRRARLEHAERMRGYHMRRVDELAAQLGLGRMDWLPKGRV